MTVKVTFNGFAWSMRLHYIMENAATIDEAFSLWESTNNTMGMCHSFASATEVQTAQYPAYALETMKGYTSFFYDNNPNEHSPTLTQTGAQTQMGYPMKDAVYRTNHGYDETIQGFGQQRVCAACGTYVEVDLSPWFGLNN
ncbi:hypothetical protein DICPUDRAFT_159676 [Dictyostelium purpureum]|uniref:Uncharacterized protein n=1 Tax=Dictyostelium purpureum TaxID=5786 RepID=F1A4Q2_DICPU|nr:uncharacterized protein DICPUDRAFT_159676 [Dictyostelium purpureum]EGC28828.1 hypothetical protein DICPUDRAFT_159676 [Dictyostelium purpureum]|eukprot:XP_003294649.1 hypothetical protein DICPUDRAFT_159676 [Dictyostelium purpureum]